MGMREIKVTMIEYQPHVNRYVYMYVHSAERGLLFLWDKRMLMTARHAI